MVRLAKSVSAILLFVFMSTAFVVLPDHAESFDWSDPIAIGDGLSGQVASISSAANKLGQIVVAWNSWEVNYSHNLLANRFVPGDGWTGAEVIVANAEIDLAAGIDDSGNCLVVWVQGASVQSRTYTVGVGWEPIVEISSSNASRSFFNMDMVMASDGSAMVIWCDMESAGYRTAYKPVVGSWQQLTAILPYPAKITCDGLGHFLAAFSMYDGVRSGIYARIFTPGSGWGTQVHIESETYDAYIGDAAMNSRGDAVAVWRQYGYPDWDSVTAFANVYSPERGWGTAAPVEELESLWCGTPIVSIDEAGNAVAIWHRQANDLSSSLRTNTYTAGVGWGTPASLEYSSNPEAEEVSAGIVGSETFAAWIHTVISGNGTYGYELVANHYNTNSGWYTPEVITTSLASSPNLVADNQGGAAITWFGNGTIGDATILDLFVSQYLKSTPPPPSPGTHVVVKGSQGPRASAVTWEYAPTDYGTWTGRIMNNGLRSLLVDVYDVTNGMSDQIMHQRIRFAANDAYPNGEVNTSGVVMSPIHRYLITVTPNGPRGSSCAVEDTFLGTTPVAIFTLEKQHTSVLVDASSSYDPDGTIVSYDWTFGDGGAASGITATHTYATPGVYEIVLTVTDNGGFSNSKNAMVIIEDQLLTPHDPILIVGNADFTPENGVISGSGTVSDPFVIAGWDIDASAATGVEIRSTTAYYILRHMWIHSGTAIQPYLHEGIKIENASNGRVERIESYDNTMDLFIRSSSNIVIVNNEFTNDFSGAVHLMSCSSIEFYNNTFVTSTGGIVVQYTSYVTAKGNSFNAEGFSFWGSSPSDFDTHLIAADNTVAGEPVIYIAHEHDIELDGVLAAQVIVASSTRVTLSGLNLSHVEQGIVLAYVIDSVVESCTLTSDWYSCAKLYYCDNVTLVGNLFSDCLYYAVETISSSRVTIRNNIVAGCSYGIVIRFYSPETLIENNTAYGNYAAVLLYQASGGVRVRYDDLSSNDIGIFMSGTTGSEVVGNRIATNAHEGIRMESGSTSNTFHHNSMISNAVQVVEEYANANTWDDGYPSGGNYWDDYGGVDLKSGPNQDQPGSDGIGDSPYVIDSDSQDRFPLMEPFTPDNGEPQTPTSSITKSTVSYGVKYTFGPINEDTPWSDVTILLQDEFGNTVVWSPLTTDLDGGTTIRKSFAAVALGSITRVWCNITDLAGNGYWNQGDSVTFTTGSTSMFSPAVTYTVTIMHDPSASEICHATFNG